MHSQGLLGSSSKTLVQGLMRFLVYKSPFKGYPKLGGIGVLPTETNVNGKIKVRVAYTVGAKNR